MFFILFRICSNVCTLRVPDIVNLPLEGASGAYFRERGILFLHGVIFKLYCTFDKELLIVYTFNSEVGSRSRGAHSV